jgi:hypothetical protein
MKQATSEVSASVIVVTAVALLTAVFFSVIWPMLRQSMFEDSNCANAICDKGYIPNGKHKGQTYCYNPYDKKKDIFYCPFKG